MEKVTVRQERYFGRLAFYPVSKTAELFCSLIKRSGSGRDVAKSLTENQLGIIKELGYEVEVVSEVIKI